ncbi:hypothetical protein BDW74DRAFT_121318 [Aspergillus multicolor]|uniref:uncharacterized protein n=1 Tax=Aspergillus multicolor TaxID=41759 RepID=UPI003CCDD926
MSQGTTSVTADNRSPGHLFVLSAFLSTGILGPCLRKPSFAGALLVVGVLFSANQICVPARPYAKAPLPDRPWPKTQLLWLSNHPCLIVKVALGSAQLLGCEVVRNY